MKYYVIKLLTNTQGQDASSISVFPDKDSEGKPIDAHSNALVAYHNTLATYHNAEDVLYAVVEIQNEYGNVEIKEIVNHKPAPEPEA